MPSEYGTTPFADDIQAMIDILDEKIVSLTATIASLEADLEGYGFDFLYKQWEYVVSNDLLKSNNAEVELNDDAYVKVKTISFNPIPSRSTATCKFRIKFDLKSDVDFTDAKGKIYKNGSPVGSEKYTDSGVWETFSEDIGSWEPGDNIELWIKARTVGYPARARNFRIYGKREGVLYLEPSW